MLCSGLAGRTIRRSGPSMMMARSAGLLLLVACTFSGQQPRLKPTANDVLTARVDSVFADIRDDEPGCAVGAYRSGEMVLARTYGVANTEDGRRITPHTTFELGSASKPFTALATLILIDQRRLSLDDDVRRYVPELPDYGKPIRIRDLLQHTSGLRDYGSLNLLGAHESNTMADFLALMSSQQRLNFKPGTRHEYSHSDFELLSLIIERVVHEPFGTYLERDVLRALGMTDSRVNDSRGIQVTERAFGHTRSQAGFTIVFNNTTLTGGGNLYTSIEDLRHWNQALAEGASGRRPLIARMLMRPTLPDGDTIPYAFGLRKGNYRGLATVSRGGHTHGTRTEIIRFPDQEFAVATLCNANHLLARQRALRVAEIYVGILMKDGRPPYKQPPAVAIRIADLQRYVGEYRSAGQLEHSRIAVEDGKLVELFGDTAQTFTYRGQNEFSADGIPGDFRLAFSQNQSGTMQMSYVSDGAVDVVWQRIAESDVWHPDSASLADYAGTYVSEEIDAVWRLAVRNGKLVVLRPGRADGHLLPGKLDQFSRHFGPWNEPLIAAFQFSRDSTGRVTHFELTTPAGEDVVRGLRFNRVRAIGGS